MSTPPSAALPYAGEAGATLEEYRPLEDRARWAGYALVAAVVAYAVSSVLGLLHLSLLDRADGGDAAAISQLQGSETRLALVGGVVFLVLVVAAVLFLRWFHRAYLNVTALGGTRRYGTWWAIGGWFIPIWWLFRPKQIANEIWRAGGESWEDLPVLYAFWWGAWLVSIWVEQFALRLFISDPGGRGEIGATAASDGLSVLAGILAVLVVRQTTARLERAADARAMQALS